MSDTLQKLQPVVDHKYSNDGPKTGGLLCEASNNNFNHIKGGVD